jgi:uncharacterized RDD family membrane protein YckC
MENRQFRLTDDLLASKGQRFLNFIIDFVVQVILYVCLGILFILIASSLGFENITDSMDNTNRFEDYLLSAIITIVYYIPIETHLSRTAGKFITGTIVVLKDGSKPDMGTIVKRTIYRLIPFDVLTFLGSGSGWHDSMSKTYVVKKQLFDDKQRLFNDFEEIGKDLEA